MPFFHNLRGVFRVAVFFLLGGTGILGVALLALYVFLRVTVLHPINAETEVEQRQATIKLTFDYILENRDGVVDESNSGRFLTVWIPRTRLTHKMCGYDWAHRGRTGIYELIAVDDHMRTMIHDGSSEQDLERYARSASPGIRDDGRRKVMAGETTLEEVLRVTRED